MKCVFTICNVAYLSRALALSESVWNYSKINTAIIILDEKRTLKLPEHNAIISWLEDYNVPEYKTLAFKYDILEFATALRPWFAEFFLKRNEKVVYLDPDMLVYNSLDIIFSDLDKHPIILTPHYTIPQNYNEVDSDLSMMRFGSFNFGFFALNNNNESFEFLNWLSKRCYHLCFAESQFGLSTDQKWVSIAPCFFPNIHISFNLGYNVAYWNMHERVINKVNNQYFINNTFPLIFFHFSSYDLNSPDNLSKNEHCPQIKEQRKEIIEISNNYLKVLNKFNIAGNKKYAYDFFSNGSIITPTLRRAYASIINELPDHNPFNSNGSVFKFAKKNHLLVKEKHKYIVQGYKDINQHKGKFKFIILIMRIVLRILGPYQAMNFSRLLVYISSYRQFRSLWK